MSARFATIFSWVCWLPLAVLVAVEVYVSGFDGWGAWAAAPLLLLPAILSLGVIAAGFIRAAAEKRAGEAVGRTFRGTAIAALPILWLLVRRYVM